MGFVPDTTAAALSGTDRLTVDPINRMEGHMGAVVNVLPATGTGESGYRVVRAELHGNLFRGFENILTGVFKRKKSRRKYGRDPRDAMIFTQRICGVCPIGHGTASSKNIGNLLGYKIHDEDPAPGTPQASAALPPNAAALRNLILAANHIMSHILHFYHLVALDYVNPVVTKPFLCPRYDDNYYINAARVTAAVPALTPECVARLATLPGWGTTAADHALAINLYLVGQYLKALDMRRIAHEMGAIFGGKLPIAAAYTPGGVTATVDSSRIGAYRNRLRQLKAFIGEPTDFANGFAGTMMFDTVAAAHLFPEYFWIGNSWSNFLAYGWGESNCSTTPLALTGDLGAIFGSLANADNRLSLRGRKHSAQAGAALLEVAAAGGDPSQATPPIAESVKHSRFNYKAKDKMYNGVDSSEWLHPWNGATNPKPAEDPDNSDLDARKYSWLKAPAYYDDDAAAYLRYEVGPLSRMVVQGAYFAGVLNVAGYGATPTWGALGPDCTASGGPNLTGVAYNGDSVLDRIAARTVETRVMCDIADHELNRLSVGAAGATDPPPAATSNGYGMTEASRGALGHWVQTDARGRIKRYQCIVPTTWNGSPRDENDNPGAAEKSLQGGNADGATLDASPTGGVHVADPDQPIEVIRTTHSYDFCIACAVHIVTPDGDVKRVVVPPLP